MALSRVLVSMATFNERDNLEGLVSEIERVLPQAEVLIIDDHSPDGTGELADDLSRRDPRLHVLHRAGKLGLGTAILAGIQYALAGNFDCFLNMDADWSHHPRYLPALLDGMKDRDLMIGSRYVPGGGQTNWPWTRHLASRSINGLARFLTRIPVRDLSGGYRCYSADLLRRVRLDNFLSVGYSFQQEMLYRCHLAGARIGETPIIFEDRRAGASKVTLHEITRSLAMIVRIGIPAFLGIGVAKFRKPVG